MSAGPAGVQEFLDFLRASGIAEAQIPAFQRVADQLLLVCDTSDLMEVSPEQTTQWREALRARNPTEAQLALIARGVSALHAFQRRRNAPPAAAALPHAVPVPQASPRTPLPQGAARAPSPSPASSRPQAAAARAKPGMSTGQKALAVGFLAVVVVGSVFYTVVASRAAFQESRGDGEILGDRNARRKIGVFSPSYTFTRQPAVACDPAVIDQVNDAVEASHTNKLKALGMLDAALHKDPHCVPAARVLSILTAQTRGPLGVLELKGRLLDLAEREPHDAAAQLIASYYARELGDGDGYRKYLERAQIADPSQPLLDNAWGSYWDLFAKPRDFPKELFAIREEIERTGDLGTVSNLAGVYFSVFDYEHAAQTCSRYAAAVPIAEWTDLVQTCLKTALLLGDKEGEAKYGKRFLDRFDGAACAHSDLALMLLDTTCRTEDALREVNLAIDRGCGEPAIAIRRGALIVLHRYEEAAEPPLDGRYFTGIHGEAYLNPTQSNNDRNDRALALGLLGRDSEARALLLPVIDNDEHAQIMLAMIDQGVLRKRLEPLHGCGIVAERAERLAGAAGGYLRWNLRDEAKPLLDEALALDPKSPRGWANKVYLASITGDLPGAAQAGEQALAMGIDNPTLAGNLGYVYQRLGQCDKAIPLFERKMVGHPWAVPNYTNLAKCYDAVGRDKEAAATWAYVLGGKPRTFWWMYVLLAAAAVGLYLGGKLALIKLAPRRFGHLKFP